MHVCLNGCYPVALVGCTRLCVDNSQNQVQSILAFVRCNLPRCSVCFSGASACCACLETEASWIPGSSFSR